LNRLEKKGKGAIGEGRNKSPFGPGERKETELHKILPEGRKVG